MSDPPQTERPAQDPTDNPVLKRVREVADDLLDGKLKNFPVDRHNLRKALDKADVAPTGREAQDKALGNISIGRRNA
jgi:hypothetical protein